MVAFLGGLAARELDLWAGFLPFKPLAPFELQRREWPSIRLK
jgi:hypothetical protein